jgi:hypothetical protein
MANYHSDEWIMERVHEHWLEALTLFPKDRIVGIFLQGSQNYGLDYEGSDIDTKLIVVPTWEDICFNRKPVSTTHIRANDEHIDLKDIRLMFQTFRKQNLNFMEILFTKYKIINPMYEEYWAELVEYNEKVVMYDPCGAVKTMKGIAMEKYHAMEHRYPAKAEIIDAWGYDPKQLHHLFRISEFIDRYCNGMERYADILIAKDGEWLKGIKKVSPTERPYFDLEAARIQAKHELDNVVQRAEAFCKNEIPKDEQVDVILDRIQEKIMRDAIMAELLAVCPECGEPLIWRANWHYPMYECEKCLGTYEKTETGLQRFFFG